MESSGDINKANVSGYPPMTNQNYLQPQPHPQPPPPTHIPQGYPPPSYQGGYVPPYQPYNYAPSPMHYVNNQNYAPPNWPQEQNNNHVSKFGVMMSTMTTLVITMCMFSLIIWILFGTQLPGFHVATFSITNLNITTSMIQADWDVNVTVLNPNPNLSIHSGPIGVSILYKNVPLATSLGNPFSIDGSKKIDLSFNLTDHKSPFREVLTLEMQKEKMAGAIAFSVRLGFGADFLTSNVWRRESLKVFCEDLKINFGNNGTGTGTLDQDSSNECLIFT